MARTTAGTSLNAVRPRSANARRHHGNRTSSVSETHHPRTTGSHISTNTATSSVHVARRALATKVLNGPESYGRDFALALVTTQTAPYTDPVILAGVNAAWDAMAGA